MDLRPQRAAVEVHVAVWAVGKVCGGHVDAQSPAVAGRHKGAELRLVGDVADWDRHQTPDGAVDAPRDGPLTKVEQRANGRAVEGLRCEAVLFLKPFRQDLVAAEGKAVDVGADVLRWNVLVGNSAPPNRVRPQVPLGQANLKVVPPAGAADAEPLHRDNLANLQLPVGERPKRAADAHLRRALGEAAELVHDTREGPPILDAPRNLNERPKRRHRQRPKGARQAALRDRHHELNADRYVALREPHEGVLRVLVNPCEQGAQSID